VSVRVENSFSSSRADAGASLLVCHRRQDGAFFACGYSIQHSDVSSAPLLRPSRSREFLMLGNEMDMYLYMRCYALLISVFVFATLSTQILVAV
jgi:hypothetical protein